MSVSRTFLLHKQLDVLGHGDRGLEEVELELAHHVALVHAAVVVRDVENSDGDVLQVLAAVPAEAAFEGAVQVGRAVVLILVYLGGGGNKTKSIQM